MAVRFRPRLWLTLAACAGVAATVALGFWQLGRAEQKSAVVAAEQAAAEQPPTQLSAASIDARSLENRRVEAHGRFETRGLVLLDNRVRHGKPGYEVIMPLELGDRDLYVLVNRGWVPAPAQRNTLPTFATPAGKVQVVGLAVVPGRRIYELSAEPAQGAVWQNLTIERYRDRMPYPIQPIMIRQSNDLQDGLVREWPSLERSIDVHRSYALQWFAMAALIAIVYVYYSLRRVPADR
jgi:surfeit locus 1 family protein